MTGEAGLQLFSKSGGYTNVWKNTRNKYTERTENIHPQSVIFPGMDVQQCVRGAVCAEVPSGWQLGTGRSCVWKGLGCLGEAYFEAMNIKKNRDSVPPE